MSIRSICRLCLAGGALSISPGSAARREIASRPAAQNCDLRIVSLFLGVSPSEVVPGGTVWVPPVNVEYHQVSYGVGAEPCIRLTGNYQLGYYLSTDSTITTADIRLAGAQGSFRLTSFPERVLTIPWPTPVGRYFLGILVDETNVENESDERNNFVSTRITVVSPQPDLLITTPLILSPPEVVPGGNVSLSGWTVQNHGTGASNPFVAGIYLSSSPIRHSATETPTGVRLAGIAGGALRPRASSTFGARTFAIPASTTMGEYFVNVLVDEAKTSNESDEDNNARSAQLPICARGDVVIPVWRLQVRLKTADVRYAGTDDNVIVQLNGANWTWLDYARDDFERNDDFTYDLKTDGVTNLCDITKLYLSKSSTDAWCVQTVELFVNGLAIFKHEFSPYRWVNLGGTDSPTLLFDFATLRNDPLWQGFSAALVPVLAQIVAGKPFTMPRSEIESRFEAFIGDAISGTQAYWGNQHGGKAVADSQLSSTSFRVHASHLAWDYPNWFDPDVDVRFTVTLGCSASALRFEISDAQVSADIPILPDSWARSATNNFENSLQGLTRTLPVPSCPKNISVEKNGDVVLTF